MQKTDGHIIDGILPGSIAEELGLEAGDILVSINDNPIVDVLDYRFLCMDEYLEILIRRGDEEAVFEVEKDAGEELGFYFENGLMDEYHSCCNKCIFCFIDQMPPGMRKTLYFKDDDERLSFLQGNYITLTSLSDHDLERIISYHLSPINISIQTMNPALRCEMLHNRFAGEVLSKLDRLYEAGITMNAQIVLCEGINDGDELEYTIKQLAKYAPVMESVSVVPVGLTKYRENLPALKPISPENANKTIDIIEMWQKYFYDKYELHFIHASDEFYLQTGRPLPEASRYDGYLQIENGVGMLTCFEEEFMAAIEDEEFYKSKGIAYDDRPRTYTIATGLLAAPFIRKMADIFMQHHPQADIQVIPIRNDFFGELITVAGLVTGQDILMQLKGVSLGEKLFIPLNMLRSGEDVFLDDVTTGDIERELGVSVTPVPCEGNMLFRALCGDADLDRMYVRYEL